MAQRAFMADAGIKLHDWTIVQDNDGHLQVSNMHTVSGTQKLFRVDTGLRMGDWRMTVDSNGDMLLSETALTGPQRPFIADAGVRVGAWTLYPTEDGDLYAKKEAILPNYTLTSTSTDADEGNTITFTLTTEGVDVGTTVPYTIAGVTSADIGGASLTGNFVTGTTDSISVTLTEDNETDPGESIWLTLQNGQASQLVTINDTSNPGTIDLSQFTYTVSLTDSNGNEVTSVNEGEEYTITTTTDAPDGSYLWVHLVENTEFSESGQSHYIDWLMDNTQSIARKPMVSGGGTTTSLSMTADNITETGFEKFTVKISIADQWADVPDNYVTQTPEITINDTSQDPVSAVYTVTPNATSVNEGQTLGFTATTNQGESVLYWNVVGGSSDINGASGSFAVSTTTGNGYFSTGTVIADQTTEGPETFTVEIRTTSATGPVVATSSAVTINDTSEDPVDISQYNWAITTSYDIPNAPNNGNPGAPNSYYLMSDYETSLAQMPEGFQAGTYTVTTNAPDGTQIRLALSQTFMGNYNWDADPGLPDFLSGDSPYGWVTVTNGTASGRFVGFDDGIAEGGEIYKIVGYADNGWSSAVVESQWYHLSDDAPDPVGSWTAPSAGETFTGGESYMNSGSPQAQWYTAADGSNGNAQIRIRMNEGHDHDLRRDISYVLDNLSVGDTFYVGTTSGTSMTVTGNITKTQVSGNYYDYYFDVSVAPGSTTYFYEYTVVAT